MLKGFVSGEEKDIVRIPMKGRNLFDESTVEKGRIDNGEVGYASQTSSLTIEGGTVSFTTTATYRGVCSGFFEIPETGNLWFNFTTNETLGVKFVFYDSSKTWLNADYIHTLTDPFPAMTTIPTDAKYVRISFTGQITGGSDCIMSDIMLNTGSTALPYEPYGYQNGWEIRDDQDRLIWGREDEFEGTDSIPINGYGTPLTSVTINGNGQQNGTPSLQNIVPFDGTGERTGNLFDKDAPDRTTTGYIKSDGTIQSSTSFSTSGYIPISGFEKITLSGYGGGNEPAYCLYDGNKEYISGSAYIGRGTLVLTVGAAAFIRMSYRNTAVDTTMLNAGSSALPYEPYGWQIPLTCNSQTTPFYLGEVPTIRRIKKLVLTGESDADNMFEYNGFIYVQKSGMLAEVNVPFCNCLIGTNLPIADAPTNSVKQGIVSNQPYPAALVFKIDGITTTTGFLNFLSTMKSAGTPVTIWYVLASPTEGIVNEPLMKIGDYSDTLTTDTPIPTTTGATDVTVDTKIPPSELTIKVHAKKIRYGFKIDKSNDDSDSAVIYTHDAVTMTPAVMDFTNDRFSYGSWGNAWFVRDARPCALKLDGTVAYYLDPNDATKKLDGTASDIYYELLSTEPADWSTQWKQYYTKSGDDYTLNDQAEAPTFATNTYYKLTYNSSFTGNFMVEFPQVWFYRHEDTSYNYIEISNYKLSDDWKCYSHINKDGTLVDRIYLPLFKGVIKDSKLRSLPGQIPQGNTTATTEVNAATALGSRWQIWDHSSAELINDLLTLMSKSIDSQGRFGQGRSTGHNSADTVTYGKLQTGTLIKKGKFHGYSATTKEVKAFGIEGFWANRWDRLQGMLLVNNVWKIKMTPPYNFTGTDFVTLSNAEVPSGDGYLSKVQTSEYGSIPASVANGSSSKYFKDYFYKTATSTRVAIRGGNCGHGGNAGFRYVGVNSAASNSYWHIGASPVYK